jgi:cell fate regulator YaaT (PSP1 superfamily)
MANQLITGKKSLFPTNAIINRNFIIRVLENPKSNPIKNTKLRTANTISKLINDERLKMKLFEKVLNGKEDKYTFLIRNRLRIDFCSK